MLEITGKYGTAEIMTDSIDSGSWSLLYKAMSAGVSEGTKVVVMPDCHSGSTCVVGFTQQMNRNDPRLCPNLIGADIGCNITAMKMELDPNIEALESLAAFDRFIRANIGIGSGAYTADLSKKEKSLLSKEDVEIFAETEKMIRADGKTGYAMKASILSQLKSVGSGNHFIELGKDSEGFYWLTVHSGSRNLGLTVAKIYQHHAVEYCRDRCEKDIKYLDRGTPYFDQYVFAVTACQRFSQRNHELILHALADYLLAETGRRPLETVGTMHNYMEMERMIVRKGAVSADRGQMLLIPFNMRDGIALCEGKGNADWNWSAPHGAGRLLSRGEAKVQLDLDAAKREMTERGIFSTSLDSCIDETAGAYKPMQEILDRIAPTVTVKDMIRPVYNIKGGS